MSGEVATPGGVPETKPDGADVELTTFQKRLLAVGATGPKIGQEIKDELDQVYDKPVNHGRLYPNLDELIDLGLMEREPRDRRSNYYPVTDRGLDVLVRETRWFVWHLEQAWGGR